MEQAPPPSAVVKSAGRVLRILELFDEIRREARIAEIASLLDYPQSSTSALLKSLVQIGYLDYNATTHTYLPSVRVTLLGSWLGEGPVRDGALIRMMEELSQKTGENVVLATRNDTYAHYIHVLHATNAMRLFLPAGSRRPIVWSGAGFVLLGQSGLSNAQISALVRRTNSEAPPEQPRIDPEKVWKNVELARKQGYYFSREIVTAGAGFIGVALPHGLDRANRSLALGISGWLEHLEREEHRFVKLMRDAISRYIPADTFGKSLTRG